MACSPEILAVAIAAGAGATHGGKRLSLHVNGARSRSDDGEGPE